MTMETLLKRHFWALNLVGLAVIAYLLAGSLNGFVAMQLASKSSADVSIAGLKSKDSKSRLEMRLASARASDSAAGRMDGASPFLIEEISEEPEELPEEEPEELEETPDEPGELEASYEVTSLPIKLLGTLVVVPSEYSSATVELERKDQKIVTPGFDLLGGQAKVHAIRRTYLILEESGKLTIAPLWPRPNAPKATAGRTSPSRPAKPATTSARAKPRAAKRQVAEGVRKISDTSFQIERSVINKKLKNLGSLGQQARVVPNYHNGKYDGFRMIGMRGDSLFAGIGMKNGDIIKVINGNRIDSPNKALALYEALKNKSRLTVQIERGGMLKTLRYIVR